MSRVADAEALLGTRGYIRNDQELPVRVRDQSPLKRQLEGVAAVKTILLPSYTGYASLPFASLCRAAKAYVPDDPALNVLGIIRRDQPVPKKAVLEACPYSPEITSKALTELTRGAVIGQDTDSRYVEVPDSGMDRFEALKEVARMHFRDFGAFSASRMSEFLECGMQTTREVLAALEAEDFVRKGFFIEGDPTLVWMLAEDVGREARPLTESFVLNGQDELALYLKDVIKRRCGSIRSVIMHGTEIIGSFKGKVSSSGAKVEEFEGSDRASRVLMEAAQSAGVRLESEREREDDDWDVAEFYAKLNLGP